MADLRDDLAKAWNEADKIRKAITIMDAEVSSFLTVWLKRA
jgi:hypothetical protein